MASAGARRFLPSVVGLSSIVLIFVVVEILIRVGLINRFIVPLPSDVAKSFGRVIVEEDIFHRFLLTGWECLAAGVLLTVFGVAVGVLLHQVPLFRRACETWVAAMASAPLVLAYPLFLVLFGRSALTIIMLAFVAGLAPVILKTIEGLSTTRRVLLDVGRSFKLTPAQQFWKIYFPSALPTIFVGIRLGLIFALINVVGVEFLINFGGLGHLINELAERYDLRRHLCGDLFRRPGQHRVLHGNGKGRAMADIGRLTRARGATPWLTPVTLVRVVIVLSVLVVWQVMAVSGWFYGDVVPSLRIVAVALVKLLSSGDFYWNLWATIQEVAIGLAIGGILGIVAGLVVGANKFLAKAFEPYLYYLGPTPKIIFFPVMIMWFGTGYGSKIAMGAVSCFFPIALNVAAGMRQIDQVLIRVGQSFRANPWQMALKIYLPAMRHPIINGMRLGLGVALIGTLLAETKISNRGIGFMVIDAYTKFDMPRMYAILIVLFVLAIGANTLVARLGGLDDIKQK